MNDPPLPTPLSAKPIQWESMDPEAARKSGLDSQIFSAANPGPENPRAIIQERFGTSQALFLAYESTRKAAIRAELHSVFANPSRWLLALILPAFMTVAIEFPRSQSHGHAVGFPDPLILFLALCAGCAGYFVLLLAMAIGLRFQTADSVRRCRVYFCENGLFD